MRIVFRRGASLPKANWTLPESLGNDFQIWEADWNADRVIISINGIPYYEQEIDPILMEEFRRDFFLLLNVAVGGTLGSGGEPPTGDETFPQTMLVDYVRVYQRLDDISPPELTEVTIASSNADPGFATTGDVVTVALTANEPIVEPVVTIGGTAATTVSGSGTDWQASRALTAGDADGGIEFTVEYVDLAGNAGVPASASTDSSSVTVDTIAPVLTTVTIASNNPNPAFATTGDIIEVTLAADEAIVPPVVTIGGIAAVSVGSGPNWTASRAVTADDAEGVIAFAIAYADFAGNSGVPVSESTDASSVTVNTTAPIVAIQGAPAAFSTLAAIPVSFQFSKPVNGFDVSDIQVSNGAAGGFVAVDSATYTATVTPTGLGNLVIGVPAGAATDAAGSPSLAAEDALVTSALNPAAPLLAFVGIASSNANAAFARAGDVVTISMTASEGISTPTVTIAGGPAVVTGSGDTWQATRVSLATDPEGPIAFAISNFEALDDQTPGFESTVTTDGSVVTFDVTAPTLSIVGLPATIEFLEPLAVTFQFGEDVAGFDVADIACHERHGRRLRRRRRRYLYGRNHSGRQSVISPSPWPPMSPRMRPVTATPAQRKPAFLIRPGGSSGPMTSRSMVSTPGLWTARTEADCPDPCDGVQSYLTERVTVANGLLTDRGAGRLSVHLRPHRYPRQAGCSGIGRVEIDAIMPGTQGTLPSLFLLPAIPAGETLPVYGPWPQSGEIDLVNAPNLGPGNSMLEHTLRYGLPEPEDTATTAMSIAPGVPTLDVIEYAIEWEGGEIRWFVNDVHVATQTQDNWYAYFEDADGVYTLGADAAPFDQDFYVAIGLAVGSDADSFFPQRLEIDAVRVYECVNPVDPTAGTGCSTGTGVPPVDAPSEPYVETLEVYTDTPATLEFPGAGRCNDDARDAEPLHFRRRWRRCHGQHRRHGRKRHFLECEYRSHKRHRRRSHGRGGFCTQRCDALRRPLGRRNGRRAVVQDARQFGHRRSATTSRNK